ncbi:MAG: carbamate kinase [Candidatus Heimdallarchaeota archaeon]
MKGTAIVALGGNALKGPKDRGTFEEQMKRVQTTCENLFQMVQEGWRVVCTHGNGPQVGAILLQNKAGAQEVPAMPLFVCGAESQGFIGYMLQQTLGNLFRKHNRPEGVATVVTQVVVSLDDPAFQNPTKPIGPFYSEQEASEIQERDPEITIREDAGRGYRRVVPSPEPKEIVEKKEILAILDTGNIVIATGGGGIPVFLAEEGYKGVDAVIDKDLASERLASEVDADTLVVLTDIENVYINFNTPTQTAIPRMSIEEAEKYQQEGHFAAGSMEPKITAAIRFLRDKGKRVIITKPELAVKALKGKAGTEIVADSNHKMPTR